MSMDGAAGSKREVASEGRPFADFDIRTAKGQERGINAVPFSSGDEKVGGVFNWILNRLGYGYKEVKLETGRRLKVKVSSAKKYLKEHLGLLGAMNVILLPNEKTGEFTAERIPELLRSFHAKTKDYNEEGQKAALKNFGMLQKDQALAAYVKAIGLEIPAPPHSTVDAIIKFMNVTLPGKIGCKIEAQDFEKIRKDLNKGEKSALNIFVMFLNDDSALKAYVEASGLKIPMPTNSTVDAIIQFMNETLPKKFGYETGEQDFEQIKKKLLERKQTDLQNLGELQKDQALKAYVEAIGLEIPGTPGDMVKFMNETLPEKIGCKDQNFEKIKAELERGKNGALDNFKMINEDPELKAYVEAIGLKIPDAGDHVSAIRFMIETLPEKIGYMAGVQDFEKIREDIEFKFFISKFDAAKGCDKFKFLKLPTIRMNKEEVSPRAGLGDYAQGTLLDTREKIDEHLASLPEKFREQFNRTKLLQYDEEELRDLDLVMENMEKLKTTSQGTEALSPEKVGREEIVRFVVKKREESQLLQRKAFFEHSPDIMQ